MGHFGDFSKICGQLIVRDETEKMRAFGRLADSGREVLTTRNAKCLDSGRLKLLMTVVGNFEMDSELCGDQ